MNQAALQLLTQERILDAQSLIRGKRWSFAYYVAGYAVECALKSCVLARMIDTGWVFEERSKIDDCLTHDFGKLIRIAGLTDELNNNLAASAAASGSFQKNWSSVTQWKVTDRYASKSKAEAVTLLACIVDEPDGVLAWIKKFW